MLALLFPGQGSQRPQMGQPWVEHSAWKIVDRISESSGRDVAYLLLDAGAEELRQTRNSQLAAFGLSMVILEAARAEGIPRPTAAAGHSLGEYSALVAAGALDISAAARLVTARGEAMQSAAEASPGTMAAVLGLDASLVAEACEASDAAWPANDNAPGQIVIAGTVWGVEKAAEAARSLGAKRVMPLPVGGAFHSPLMAPAQPLLDAALAETDMSPTSLSVVCNVDAAAHDSNWHGLLSAQLVSPVRWRESLLTLSGMGVTHFLELGPGSELSGMVKRTLEGSIRANVATPEGLTTLEGFLRIAPR